MVNVRESVGEDRETREAERDLQNEELRDSSSSSQHRQSHVPASMANARELVGEDRETRETEREAQNEDLRGNVQPFRSPGHFAAHLQC